MDIRKSLEAEHSRAMTTRIVNYVGDDQERFDELFRILMEADYKLAQRAAWPVGDIVESNSSLIRKHIVKALKKLRDPLAHDAVRRNLMKALVFAEIPEKYCGEALDLCYEYIRSEVGAVAIRAHAMSVALNICLRFPELKDEFRIVLGEMNTLPQSPAIRVRLRDVLKKLR